MYGLKQAGKIWGSLLLLHLLSWKFEQTSTDPRALILRRGPEVIIIIIVIDHMMFVTNSLQLLSEVKERLEREFDVKFFGSISSFICWDIRRSLSGIECSQQTYARKLISKHGLNHANGTWTPLPVNCDIRQAQQGEVHLQRKEHMEYRQLVGELLYLSVCTRPDISFAVGALARSLHAPTQRHSVLAKRVLRYVSGNSTLGIFYPETSNTGMQAYSDADWAGCLETRHSTSGFIISVNGAPVSWKSTKQSIVALSSAESEFVSLATASRELSWLRRIYAELSQGLHLNNCQPLAPTTIYTDSTAAIALIQRDGTNARTKHISVRYNFVKDLNKNGVISLQFIRSQFQLADILTKPVNANILRSILPFILQPFETKYPRDETT